MPESVRIQDGLCFQSESSKFIPLTLHSKGVKLDSDYGKPPIVSTRATSKGFILKRRSKSAQDVQLIEMSPPKQKCYGRETIRGSLNDHVDPPVLDATNSEHNLEGPKPLSSMIVQSNWKAK